MNEILLVDDEPSIRKFLAEVIERAGYAVVAVENAEQAEIALKEHSFGLLLTDVILPGMCGAELARKAREKYPEMPVCGMSGQVPNEHSFNAFVSKPFTRSQLLDTIERFFTGAHHV